MKKVLSLILVLTLVLAMSVPALAENETGGTTRLSFEVESKYSVVIPDSISLRADTNRVLTGSGEFSVTAGSLIDANKTLKLAITGAANYSGGFYLVNSSKTDVKLPYTISNAVSEGTAVAKDDFFLTATAEEAFTGKAQSLYLTSAAYTQAGTYTDTLTITVTVA